MGNRETQGSCVFDKTANATTAPTYFLQTVGSAQTVAPQALVLSHASHDAPATDIAVTSRNHATAPKYVSMWRALVPILEMVL
ncbi:unnamed protein product [Prunus armeniaca]|uniref:Uncharacterized protein n=1 Tax=Prunus armeniaca TaxID=36596 RepID=A0A6J5XRA6_PRUAR|nr:unnamed protein product [Prunus armeniaca]